MNLNYTNTSIFIGISVDFRFSHGIFETRWTTRFDIGLIRATSKKWVEFKALI